MYDIIVIGGGPGGYLAAERAGQAGLKTLLVEKTRLGGVCLNEGCIPSKVLLNSAKLYDYTKGETAGYGVTSQNAAINHGMVIQRKNTVVDALCRGVEMQMKKSGAETVNTEALITGKCAKGFQVKADDKTYVGKNLIIASGANAIIPPIDGAEAGVADGFCMTSREALEIRTLPKELAIIGGGAIGLEFASYFNSIGVKVTVIEALGKIGGVIDEEIAKQLQRVYEKRGVKIWLDSKVTQITKNSVVFQKNREEMQISCDKVLLSVGRRANVQVGLDSIGVSYTPKGIETDSRMRTNVSNVYAIGDCTGKSMLAHCAYRAAEVAVNNIIGKNDTIENCSVPSVIYTHPEVASAGITEEEAKVSGKNYRVIRLPAAYSGRAMAESNDGIGMCKLIVDKDTDTFLGMHLFSPYASEIIVSCVMMIDERIPIDRIKKFIFPHPTVGELIREALFY